MKVGVIGAGSLGSALGERLGKAGHEIMFGGAATVGSPGTELEFAL